MNIYHSIEDFNPVPNAVVTSGTFDGVHLGHQKIIHRLNEIAERVGGSSVVITYWPHPRLVLFPDDTSLKLLNTFEEKALLLKSAGVQHLLRIPFTKEFSSISSLAFIQNILVEKIGTKKLVIGYDHRFGKNREGSFNELKANGPGFGFEVEEIPRQEIDEITISSSAIRRHLSAGEIKQANQLLGRPYSISGRVVNGEKLGRVLGFPTANIDTDSGYKLIPSEGIYAVRINYGGGIFDGMLYIGNRPTLGGTRQSIEVNIFDFDKTIYGESLTIHLIEQIRGDSTFSDLEALRLQMITDKQHTLEVLRNNKLPL
ncbi:MAG: bifunctional riboflavin kinase/FAD synthetase [Bacteroidetes bacterium]|nr:bifunctional riboflavin kinase/FAD synthetase [Bacteroidota bacterium]